MKFAYNMSMNSRDQGLLQGRKSGYYIVTQKYIAHLQHVHVLSTRSQFLHIQSHSLHPSLSNPALHFVRSSQAIILSVGNKMIIFADFLFCLVSNKKSATAHDCYEHLMET